MGLSTRLIRVSREDMKCIIIAAVLVAFVAADGSMPTVSEVDMMPETELVEAESKNFLSRLAEDRDRTPMFTKRKQASEDLHSAIKDRVSSPTDETSAAVEMAYGNVMRISQGRRPIRRKEQQQIGGAMDRYNSEDGFAGISGNDNLSNPNFNLATARRPQRIRKMRRHGAHKFVKRLYSIPRRL